MKTISDYTMEAIAADDAWERELRAQGFHSRWDQGATGLRVTPEGNKLADLYDTKVAADKAANEAWERSRQSA